MLVTLIGFGSIWEVWQRATHSDQGEEQTAFFNTTGIGGSEKAKYKWKTGGKLRFNSGSQFNPHFPARSLNKVWECREPGVCERGWIQMLCWRQLPKPERPDYYLFRLATSRIGLIDFRSKTWCSSDIQVISISEGKIGGTVEQETLVLMRPHSWVRSIVAVFCAEPAEQFWSAQLRPTFSSVACSKRR